MRRASSLCWIRSRHTTSVTIAVWMRWREARRFGVNCSTPLASAVSSIVGNGGRHSNGWIRPEETMTNPAFAALYEVWDKALDDPIGVRVKFTDQGSAT